MAHEIETMFSGNRVLPWHGLGEIVEGTLDSEAALVKAGLAWGVAKEPIFLSNGTEVPDYKAVVRMTDKAQLGVVGNRYQVVQNLEAFRWVDSLLEVEGGEVVQYETAGSLRGGKRVWMLARLGDPVQVVGDDTLTYLCFTNSHDGSTSVKVALTPVRVVCMNTLSMALRQATRVWSTPHIGNIRGRLEEARKTLQLTTKYMSALQEDGERLAEKPMDLQEFIERLLPVPTEKAGKQAEKNVLDMRELLYCHAEADDLKPFAGTAWRGVQAVTSFTTHAQPIRQTETWRERRWESLIDGHQLQQKAHELAWAMVGGRG